MDVDAVKEWPGDAAKVSPDLAGCAATGLLRVTIKSAGTGLRCHFVKILLKAQRPLPPEYPKELKTLGNHIRKKRLEQGLLQKDVAKIIGTSEDTITNWENNISQPSIRWIPKIIDFLGYAPYSPAKSLGKKLANHRKHLGLSQKQLAKIMGVDPTSIRDWECGIHKPIKKSLIRIKKVFK